MRSLLSIQIPCGVSQLELARVSQPDSWSMPWLSPWFPMKSAWNPQPFSRLRTLRWPSTTSRASTVEAALRYWEFFRLQDACFFLGTVGIHLGNALRDWNGSNTHINIYGSFCWDKHPLTSFFSQPCCRWLIWPSHMLIWSNGLGILNHQPVFPESEWCNGTLLVDGSGGVLPATNRVLGDE